MLPVHAVQVFLLELWEPDARGELQPVSTGPLPMRWRHHETNPLPREIGAPADCDLLRVTERELVIAALVVPHRVKLRFSADEAPVHRRVVLEARGVEVDSPPLTIDVHWDGKWSEDAEKMKRHLIVSTAHPSE